MGSEYIITNVWGGVQAQLARFAYSQFQFYVSSTCTLHVVGTLMFARDITSVRVVSLML